MVIGDSISSGVDPHVDPWPLVLQQITGIPVKKLARPGAGTAEAQAMAKSIIPHDHLLLIEIGGNDLLAGVKSSEFEGALDALLARVRHARAHRC